MVRGRVQLKRIENKINRQVTFSKRRSGLLKKAHEISVLCDAEVALIVFSTMDKVYEYSTNSSMETILERYEQYSHVERAFMRADPESQESWCYEYGKLKTKAEALHKGQRHLMGEQLDSLSLKELQQLDQQLESSLNHIRSKKTQLLCDSITELQMKEKSLEEKAKTLEKKLQDTDKVKALMQHAQWEHPGEPQPSSSSPPSFLLNIGTYQARGGGRTGEEATALPVARIGSSTLPPWMLRNVNG